MAVALTRDPLERFFEKVRVDVDGCWYWEGTIAGLGYGYFRIRRTNYRAHRWLYRVVVGGIPEGLDLDHLCRNRLCVNPEHLEPVTRSENLRRGMTGKVRQIAAAKITHCPQGHPYNEDNTGLRPTKHGGLSRRCRSCEAAAGRERYRKSKGGVVQPRKRRRP